MTQPDITWSMFLNDREYKLLDWHLSTANARDCEDIEAALNKIVEKSYQLGVKHTFAGVQSPETTNEL